MDPGLARPPLLIGLVELFLRAESLSHLLNPGQPFGIDLRRQGLRRSRRGPHHAGWVEHEAGIIVYVSAARRFLRRRRWLLLFLRARRRALERGVYMWRGWRRPRLFIHGLMGLVGYSGRMSCAAAREGAGAGFSVVQTAVGVVASRSASCKAMANCSARSSSATVVIGITRMP